jgi:hypothetical protein
MAESPDCLIRKLARRRGYVMTQDVEHFKQSATEDLLVETEENQLTLREMSDALPGTRQIMQDIGHCWWSFIYAARGGNWDLAVYYLRGVNHYGEMLKVLRPKHLELFSRFQKNALPAVAAALEARDLDALEKAYGEATDFANRMHAAAKHPYVRWVLPDEPPKGLDLGSAGT